MHEEVIPNSLLALHAISVAGGTRLSLRAWSWKERVCFFPVASVRNPRHLLFLSFWDVFALNLFWSFCFSLSYSSFEWTLPVTKCISTCRKVNQSSWSLLERFACFFPPSYFFSSNLYFPLVWWGGRKKFIFRSSKMKTTHCFCSSPGSTGWES